MQDIPADILIGPIRPLMNFLLSQLAEYLLHGFEDDYYRQVMTNLLMKGN